MQRHERVFDLSFETLLFCICVCENEYFVKTHIPPLPAPEIVFPRQLKHLFLPPNDYAVILGKLFLQPTPGEEGEEKGRSKLGGGLVATWQYLFLPLLQKYWCYAIETSPLSYQITLLHCSDTLSRDKMAIKRKSSDH